MAKTPAEQPEKSIASIDMNNLDKEWADHPERVEKFGLKVAKAKKRVAELKQAVKVMEADLKEKIRSNPEDYGVEEGKKPSEERLKDLVVLQPELQQAVAQLIEAEYSKDIYGAAMEALSHRKDGLKDMVYLWGQTYFARPSEKRKP